MSLERLPSEDGMGHEKLQIFKFNSVRKPRLPMEAGVSPEKLMPMRINVSSELLYVKLGK